MECLICKQEFDATVSLIALLTFASSQMDICEDCRKTFEKLPADICLHCSKPSQKKTCLDCKNWMAKGYTPHHISLYHYNQGMKQYFSTYKFMGDYLLRRVFQKDMKRLIIPYIKLGFTVVPVPLSKERFEDRGFNQVEGLLENIPYHTLFRKTEIEKQSSKNRKQRLEQENPFYIEKESHRLPEKLLIVDDIYTTGATICQLVTLARENGVQEIVTASLAR